MQSRQGNKLGLNFFFTDKKEGPDPKIKNAKTKKETNSLTSLQKTHEKIEEMGWGS